MVNLSYDKSNTVNTVIGKAFYMYHTVKTQFDCQHVPLA